MNRTLALAIVIVTIGVLVLTLCVQAVKSEPYIDEQAGIAFGKFLVMLVIFGSIAIAILVAIAVLFLQLLRRYK